MELSKTVLQLGPKPEPCQKQQVYLHKKYKFFGNDWMNFSSAPLLLSIFCYTENRRTLDSPTVQRC